jgi:hypothetical protein
MKNSKFTFLQRTIQQRRRSAEDTTFKDTEFKMTSQRKEFLEMLEEFKRDIRGNKK